MDLAVGAKIRGNINNAIMSIEKLENNGTVVIKDMKTGKLFSYGYEALKKCNITILA